MMEWKRNFEQAKTRYEPSKPVIVQIPPGVWQQLLYEAGGDVKDVNTCFSECKGFEWYVNVCCKLSNHVGKQFEI